MSPIITHHYRLWSETVRITTGGDKSVTFGKSLLDAGTLESLLFAPEKKQRGRAVAYSINHVSRLAVCVRSDDSKHVRIAIHDPHFWTMALPRSSA